MKLRNLLTTGIFNGFVTIQKEKMSKSLGNITTIEEATKVFWTGGKTSALLSSQYKQPLDWNSDLLSEQAKVIDKWYSMYSEDFSEKTLSVSIIY